MFYAIAASLIFSGALAQAATISGTITDKTTNKPAAGDTIELLDVHLTVHGAERVPPDRAYVYMSNHQSHLDIPILYATLPSPTIRMLAKKELFQIPLWGRGLRAAEFVEVDRGNHSRAVKSIEHAAELIQNGVSIWNELQ